jgi:hypothetical protein
MATYSKIEHGLYENPKIVGLSDAAFRAYVESILYSGNHLTDGFLDERIVRRMWGDEIADELCSNDPVNPSWARVDGGFKIYGFCERQTMKADVDALKEQKTRAGIASGRARRNKQRTQNEHSVEHNANTTRTKHEPDTDTDVKDLYNDVAQKSVYTEPFETFWAAYPRKQQKGDAFKAWETLRKKKLLPHVSVIVDAATVYASNVTDPQFQKLPAGWLRASAWEDQVAEKKPQRDPNVIDFHDKPGWGFRNYEGEQK